MAGQPGDCQDWVVRGGEEEVPGLRGWTPGRGQKRRGAGWRCALRRESLAVPDRLGAPELRPAVGQIEGRIGNREN